MFERSFGGHNLPALENGVGLSHPHSPRPCLEIRMIVDVGDLSKVLVAELDPEIVDGAQLDTAFGAFDGGNSHV